MKIRMQGQLGEQSAHIGEGESGATADLMSTHGCLLQEAVGVDPGQRGRHQAEVQMIGDGVRCARLSLGAADFLLDFLEPGFDSPARLEPALAYYMIIAWRVLYLTMLGRDCPGMHCEAVFANAEWKAAYLMTQRKPPPE